MLRHIEQLKAYVPGDQPEGEGWVKLNTNENPFPPSPRVVEAIREVLGREGNALRLYPNPTSQSLREAIAEHHGVCVEQAVVGNGSDDILNLLVRAYCDGQHPAGFMGPSYSLYPVLVGIQGGRWIEVPFGADMNLDVEAILQADAPIFFLTSPNAPAGVGFSQEVIASILDEYSGLLVVDEAYAAFAREDAVGLLKRYSNLCITRTFSKSHGLAGLRVGYALADADVVDVLDRVRDSYNVDALAQAGAMAALQDGAYYEKTIAEVVQLRDALASDLMGRGWFVYPSQANFVLAEPVSASGESGSEVAESLYEYLKERKILVRYFKNDARVNRFLRISVGTKSEMAALTKALDG